MKSGLRAIHADAKLISLEGQECAFVKGSKVEVVSLHRKEGLCEVAEQGTFRCKKIRGISSMAKQ